MGGLLRNLLAFLLLLSGLAFAAVSPKTITSSFPMTDVKGNVLANGTLIFKLANPDNVVGGGQLVQGPTVVVNLTAGGLIPNGTTLYATDQLQSTGNYYIVNFFNSNGLLVRGPENWRISGASPIDMSLEVNALLPDPGLSNPVLQNPAQAQTITGQPLSLTGSAPLSVTRMLLSDQGSCTMTAGTCTAQNLASTYSVAPLCVVTWTGSGTLTGLLKVTSTTSKVTPSSSVNTDTAVVNFACFGN